MYGGGSGANISSKPLGISGEGDTASSPMKVSSPESLLSSAPGPNLLFFFLFTPFQILGKLAILPGPKSLENRKTCQVNLIAINAAFHATRTVNPILEKLNTYVTQVCLKVLHRSLHKHKNTYIANLQNLDENLEIFP